MGMAGLALDLGHLYLAKTELQRAADAGALAGSRGLFFPSLGTPPQCSQAQTTAWEIAQANTVHGSTPTVSTPPSYALPYGIWNYSAKIFTPGCSSNSGAFTNAVTVRTTLIIPLMFMGALGFGPITLNADSLSIQDWVGGLAQGASFILALGKNYAMTEPVETYIYTAPDNTDSGAWFTKSPVTPSNAAVKSYLDYPSTMPPIQTGDQINLNNGAWGDILAIIRSDYIGKTVWLPVVDLVQSDQTVPVIGFTAFKITGVGTGSPKYVKGLALKQAEIQGDSSSPGGAYFGLLTSPRLVQ